MNRIKRICCFSFTTKYLYFKYIQYTPSYTFLIRIYYVFKRSCISILITGKSFVCVNVACFCLHHNEVFHCCTKWSKVRFSLWAARLQWFDRQQPFDFRARVFDFVRRLTANETTATGSSGAATSTTAGGMRERDREKERGCKEGPFTLSFGFVVGTA